MASVLVAWIGEDDIGASEPGTLAHSRIHHVVADEFYSTVMLLSTASKKSSRAYRKWLATKSGVNVELDRRKLESAFDLPEVYRTTVGALEECKSRYLEDEDVEFSFLLGADSPVMDAVLILLAHTRYAAELIHWTEAGGTLPLDLPSGDVLALIQGQAPGVALRKPLSQTATFNAFVHKTEVMDGVLNRATRMAVVDVPMLITGEGGTGRELLARAIHKASTRSRNSFIPVMCGALSGADQEVALFGTTERPGAFQKAQGGVVYIEGIDKMHPAVQTGLYQVLREGRVTTGEEEISVSARVIASTTQDLRRLVADGMVLDSLFNELAIGIVEIPPLRDRGDDIDLIVNDLMKIVNNELGQDRTVSDGARQRIRDHQWPGNVGELKAVLRRAAVWADGEILSEHIDASILPITLAPEGDSILELPLSEVNIHDVLDDVSRHYLQRALEESSGNKTKAAAILGLNNYQTLTNWMARLGI